MKMQDQIRVSDMPLAVTLTTLGFPLETIDRTNSDRFQFCFKYEKRLEDAVQAFWRGELKIEPKILFLNHKLLKSRLYANK